MRINARPGIKKEKRRPARKEGAANWLRPLCLTGCLIGYLAPVCRSGPVCFSSSAACAAASLAVNNRKGEHDT